MKTLVASNSAIKEQRAQMLGNATLLEVETKLNNLKRDKSKIEETIANLSDLAPLNKQSLQVGGADFKAEAWVNDLFQAEIALMEKEIEIEVMEKLKAKWFTDEKD
jgi:hypothetical protein